MAWSRTHGLVTLTVDPASFGYTVSLASQVWLGNGTVAMTCGGERFASEDGTLTRLGLASEYEGSDSAGPFEAIEQRWQAGACAELVSAVRFYSRSGAVEFVTSLPGGASGTATSPVGSRAPYGGRAVPCNTSTEFPSFVQPPARAPPGLGWLSWNGCSVLGPAELHRPSSAQGSADFGAWRGGLVGGPLVLFGNTTGGEHPPAVVLGPSSAFKASILSPRLGRIVGGVQGYVPRLPSNFSTSFALLGRAGVTAAAVYWGAHLRRARAAGPRLTLDDDQLSRTLHYLTDGGSNLNYCDYWGDYGAPCANSSAGCTPMSVTLRRLAEYHASLPLAVGLYHLDPFWWSHEPLGGCSLGAAARNLTASPFHFPSGLAALGLPVQLVVGSFTPDNVYADDYAFEGWSVAGADAARFWAARLPPLATDAMARSLVWQSLDYTWFSSDARLASATEEEAADGAFAAEALRLGLPLRVDGAAPSDVLAFVGRGAVTALRVTGDSVPHDWFERTLWLQLGANSLLPASLGVRPMVDVLWTTPTQVGDPRWAGRSRANLRHDLSTAVLSTGPVGFGDLLGHTDAAMLRRAVREDGTLLKPCFPALRVDRYYTATGGAEIWAAPTGPAGDADSRRDARANSMARLEEADGEEGALWWWQVLGTNVGGGGDAPSRPLGVSELWPAPDASARYLVAQIDAHAAGAGDGAGPPRGGLASRPCVDGAPARTCLALWSAGAPLNVSTPPASGVQRSFSLLAAAPVLPSGWALLGDLRKLVPVSPQRFVAPAASAAPHADDLDAAGVELRVIVLGTAGEGVEVTLVAPPAEAAASPLSGTVRVLELGIGPSGQAVVSCAAGKCRAEEGGVAS